jgi:hypothetical protein
VHSSSSSSSSTGRSAHDIGVARSTTLFPACLS